MDVGIIGAGNIGTTVAKLLAGAGHRVAVSNSRGPESLAPLVEQIGPLARAATPEEAAGFGEVVLVAVPFFAYESLPAERLAGKIVIDATNYYEVRDGPVDFGGLTSSEFIASELPGSRIVKAFNTMYYETLATGGRPDAERKNRLVLFVAGDDAEAKAVVSRLIEDIGFEPVDTGTLSESRRQEPGSPIYNVPMTADEARETLAGMG
jgi:8-hydroxy-5-deazaflavin:NADPH oxidoreductase